MVLVAVLVTLITGSCGINRDDPARVAGGSEKTILINGAGASFPYPLYSHWINEYGKLQKKVNINYQSMGSGAGIE